MRVRPAVASDLTAIEAFDPFTGDRAREIGEGRCLVADDGGAVGYVAFRDDGCVGHPFITYLAIAPTHRRRGLGRTLIAAVAERLGPRLFISTERANQAMLALLAGDRWREVGEIREVNASGHAEVFFVKTFACAGRSALTGIVSLSRHTPGMSMRGGPRRPPSPHVAMSDTASVPAIVARRATDADIALLAEAELLVSVMPDGHSLWDDVAVGERALDEVVRALFSLRAWHWANVEDFTILEVDGAPAALAGVFDARDGAPRIPVDLDRTPELAERLGWRAGEAEAFGRTYRGLWGDDLSWLVPQAPAILETVAVLPAFRGLRLGDRLMDAVKADARARGFDALGVMVVAGNVAAERLYGRHFEPFVTYHAGYFGGFLPGITKYRADLR